MKYRFVIAIDPGKSGGICVFNSNTGVKSVNMPITPTDLHQFLKRYSVDSYCYLEKVHGMPGMSGGGMFTFGQGYGWLEMALIALKIPTESVTPQKWQKTHEMGTKGKLTTTQWKNKLKAKAQQLFPDQKVFLWNADALLILHYGLDKLKQK